MFLGRRHYCITLWRYQSQYRWQVKFYRDPRAEPKKPLVVKSWLHWEQHPTLYTDPQSLTYMASEHRYLDQKYTPPLANAVFLHHPPPPSLKKTLKNTESSPFGGKVWRTVANLRPCTWTCPSITATLKFVQITRLRRRVGPMEKKGAYEGMVVS